jgi:hypothetical protein
MYTLCYVSLPVLLAVVHMPLAHSLRLCLKTFAAVAAAAAAAAAVHAIKHARVWSQFTAIS